MARILALAEESSIARAFRVQDQLELAAGDVLALLRMAGLPRAGEGGRIPLPTLTAALSRFLQATLNRQVTLPSGGDARIAAWTAGRMLRAAHDRGAVVGGWTDLATDRPA
jgi:hypothetical protein